MNILFKLSNFPERVQ